MEAASACGDSGGFGVGVGAGTAGGSESGGAGAASNFKSGVGTGAAGGGDSDGTSSTGADGADEVAVIWPSYRGKREAKRMAKSKRIKAENKEYRDAHANGAEKRQAAVADPEGPASNEAAKRTRQLGLTQGSDDGKYATHPLSAARFLKPLSMS